MGGFTNRSAHAEVIATSTSVKAILTLLAKPLALALVVGSASASFGFAQGATGSDRLNRSRFEYHDGRSEEKRRYILPKTDADPTNIALDEMKERVVHLEERVEYLERLLSSQPGARR